MLLVALVPAPLRLALLGAHRDLLPRVLALLLVVDLLPELLQRQQLQVRWLHWLGVDGRHESDLVVFQWAFCLLFIIRVGLLIRTLHNIILSLR